MLFLIDKLNLDISINVLFLPKSIYLFLSFLYCIIENYGKLLALATCEWWKKKKKVSSTQFS